MGQAKTRGTYEQRKANPKGPGLSRLHFGRVNIREFEALQAQRKPKPRKGAIVLTDEEKP